MARRYPRMQNDGYPDVQQVDPFRRQVTFDYSRYDYTAYAKVMRVPWPSDYRHTVDWASAEARDMWFESQEGQVIELSTGVLHSQLDTIQLDVPYDVALTYNYVYMRVPPITQGKPIEHEGADGMRTICAFVRTCEYLSPSATNFVLDVDVWTTYLLHKSVRGMMLERGHAPMWALTAEEFLSDPIHRCTNLLTPDVAVRDASVVRSGEYQPLSLSHPLYVMASNIPYSDIDRIPLATDEASSPPTYYDTGARNGEQVGVSGYRWPGGSYEGMSNPSTPTHAEGSAPTGLYYYGLMGSAVASGALSALFEALPVFATSIQAVFVVPSDLVTVGTQHSINNVPLREVHNKGLQPLRTFYITADMFGYNQRYAGIAKLYTAPYAHLEISDDLGGKVTVAVEDTDGSIAMSQMLSLAYPAIEWRAAITNAANTAGDVRYSWTQLDGTSKAKTLTNADFAETFLNFGIPTFALYMEARSVRALTAWADAQQKRADALLSYQNTMRSANTGEANAIAANATAKGNADRSADTNVTNVANNGRNSTANTGVRNNLRATLTALNSAAASDVAEIQAQGIYDLGAADDEYTMYASDTNLKGEAVTAAANMAGAASVGNVLGTMQAGISGIVNITTSSSLASLSSQNIVTKEGINQGLVRDTTQRHNTLADSTTVVQNSADNTTNTNDVATANANAQNSAATTKANASATQGTGNANAGYTRDTAEENAKASLVNAQASYARSLTAESVTPPAAYGAVQGDMAHEVWESKGVHLRVITQSAGDIKRAGDTFLRYGYALNAAWTLDEWVPDGMRYCYWQSADVWQDLAQVGSNETERVFEAILAAGVTVWGKPEDVGRFY